MIQSITSQGLVLYNRNFFREDDKLVQDLQSRSTTDVLVKHAGQSKLAPVIQPLVLARFLFTESMMMDLVILKTIMR